MWFYIVGGVFLFLVFAFFLTLYVIFSMTFRVPRAVRGDPHFLPDQKGYNEAREEIFSLMDHALTLPFTDVWTESRDGLRLHGRYFHRGDGLPVRILVHGYRGSAYRDFSGGIAFALGEENNVLLIDQRAHGKSAGRALSFGILERYDVLSWIEFVQKEYGEEVPIVLSGLSMGAATVLMAAELPLPPSLRLIIADSGYSSPGEIIYKVIGDLGLPPSIFYPLVRLSGKIYGGFDIESASAEAAVTRATVPIFYVHGEGDDFVPTEMSRRCHRVTASKTAIFTVPGAGHGLSFILDGAGFASALRDFCARERIFEKPEEKV